MLTCWIRGCIFCKQESNMLHIYCIPDQSVHNCFSKAEKTQSTSAVCLSFCKKVVLCSKLTPEASWQTPTTTSLVRNCGHIVACSLPPPLVFLEITPPAPQLYYDATDKTENLSSSSSSRLSRSPNSVLRSFMQIDRLSFKFSLQDMLLLKCSMVYVDNPLHTTFEYIFLNFSFSC